MFDAVLQGQTYDSAKAFFAQTFRPLAQGIIYLCEELIRQNNAFPNDFQSKVATTDVIEQEIKEQMLQIDRTKAGIEGISNVLPAMQAMMGIFDAMKQKLQEKLEHLYEFNYTSSSNYDTAIQLAASIARGLAEVQGGKGFSPASGTFSTQELNMDWAASIQKIAEDKAHEAHPLDADSKMNDSLSEESIWEKFGQAWNSFYVGSGQVAGTIIEGIPKVWNGFYVGSGRVIGDIIEGVPKLFDYETWENAGYVILNLDEVLPNMCNVLSDSFIKNVWNGDAESIAEWITYAFGQVGTMLFSDKGVSKLNTITKETNFLKVTEVKVSRIQQTVTNWVDNLSIGNRLAFADTNGFNLRSSFDSSAFNKAEDTMVYAKTTGGKPRVKDVQEVIQDYADKVLDRVKVEGKHPDSYTESKVLREELKEVGIEPPPYPNAAHHIAPWNDKRAAQVQELLEEFGIHHNSAANGVFLPGYGAEGHKYVTTEALHIGNHSPEYIREVYRVLSEVKRFEGNQADAVAALQKIRERLLDCSLKLNEPK